MVDFFFIRCLRRVKWLIGVEEGMGAGGIYNEVFVGVYDRKCLEREEGVLEMEEGAL